MKIDALLEYKKWINYDSRLIFTNCGALTWYLRKAWLLDNAPELMPAAMPGESFEIRRTVRSRLAKTAYYTHVWIRARLAFAERLPYLHDSVRYPGPNIGTETFRSWNDEQSWDEPARDEASERRTEAVFALPGKPRYLKVADVGREWIYLKWKWPKSATTRFGYRIERSLQKNGVYTTIATTHACDLLLLPVRSALESFYRVRAFNPSAEGPASGPISATAF
jgi:hypothetical protein